MEIWGHNLPKLGVLRTGFLRPITDRPSQKAVSAELIADTNLFKAFFFIIYNYL